MSPRSFSVFPTGVSPFSTDLFVREGCNHDRTLGKCSQSITSQSSFQPMGLLSITRVWEKHLFAAPAWCSKITILHFSIKHDIFFAAFHCQCRSIFSARMRLEHGFADRCQKFAVLSVITRMDVSFTNWVSRNTCNLKRA